MKRLILICLFSIALNCYSQVPVPGDFTVAIMPQTPIDMSQMTEAEKDDPLSVLPDTAQIDLKVMFTLQSTLDLESVQIQVLTSETSAELLNIALPLIAEMPPGFTREENRGFFVYNLSSILYSGGLIVKIRIIDVTGNHSTYLTYPEN